MVILVNSVSYAWILNNDENKHCQYCITYLLKAYKNTTTLVCNVQFGHKNEVVDVIEALKQPPLDLWQNKIYSAEIFLYKSKGISTLYLTRLEAYPVLKRSLLRSFCLAYVEKQDNKFWSEKLGFRIQK
jgi:hypothetical protein